MKTPAASDASGSDSVLTEPCPYLGGIAMELRPVVSAQCPGCHGDGACVVREAIRTLAEAPQAAPIAEAGRGYRQATDC